MPVLIPAQGGPVTPLSAFTVKDMIEETRRHVAGTLRYQYNQLAAACGTNDLSVAFVLPVNGIVAGGTIAIEDELLYVQGVGGGNATATVIRGVDGTAPSTHLGGTIVESSPRFSTFAMRRALMEEIASWPNSIFQVPAPLTLSLKGPGAATGATGTAGAGQYQAAYDLSPLADVLHLLEVRHEPWSAGYRNSWPLFTWVELARGMPADLFPSGMALVVKEKIPTSVRVNVVYALPFNVSQFGDANLCGADIGLASSMFDIAPLGAAHRLLAPQEIERTQADIWGQERDATQVPPDMIGRAANRLMMLRDKRLAEEAERLDNRWPIRWS
jgi:hypothetical protein